MNNNTAIILILISGVLFFVFTMPQWDKVGALQAEEREHVETLRNASAIIELRDNLMSAYGSFPDSDIERIEKALPGQADLVKFAYEMDGIAGRHGIAIENVAGQAQGDGATSIDVSESSGPTRQTITVNLGFLADYPGFSAFLEDLEKSLRIVDVRELSFTVTEEGLYRHNVTVDTYWLE